MELPARELTACLGPVLLAALGMLACVVALRLGLDALASPPLVRLAACVAGGAAAAVVLLAWREPALRADVGAVYRAFTK
jgi:hypothetical protein